jgi:hypothetical protein
MAMDNSKSNNPSIKQTSSSTEQISSDANNWRNQQGQQTNNPHQ